MTSFDQLSESRRRWLSEILIPWCRIAPRRDLQRAELEWIDIAGKVDPQATLWTWAWARFPDLVSQGLSGVDETWPVTLTLRTGTTVSGYPDSRLSTGGQLVLVARDADGEATPLGPFSIDEIASVVRGDDVMAT